MIRGYMTRLERGRKVRLYDMDDWFYEGRIAVIESDTVDVDYGDWVTRYPRSALKSCWPPDGTYEEVLVPYHSGTIIADYRDAV